MDSSVLFEATSQNTKRRNEASWLMSHSFRISLWKYSTCPTIKSTLTCLKSTAVVCLSSTHIWLLPSGKQTKTNFPFLISYVKWSQRPSTAVAAAVPLSRPLWPKNTAWGFELEKPDDHHSFSILARAFSWWPAFVCLLWMTLSKENGPGVSIACSLVAVNATTTPQPHLTGLGTVSTWRPFVRLELGR